MIKKIGIGRYKKSLLVIPYRMGGDMGVVIVTTAMPRTRHLAENEFVRQRNWVLKNSEIEWHDADASTYFRYTFFVKSQHS